MVIASATEQRLDRFTPAVHDVLRRAQREAIAMHATAVEPEHLFLGSIIQGNERVMELLSKLGMDVQTARERVGEFAHAHEHREGSESELPLSKDAQACMAWALSFAALMHASSMSPEHLLLGVLRHPRVQPMLALLLPSVEELRTRLAEEIGPAYTSYVDQLIHTRVRDQSVVHYQRGLALRVLRRFERPQVTFTDLINLDEAKRDMRDLVEFLRAAPAFQFSGGRFPHGVLLVGSSANERRLLAQAVAGESVVPLLSLSLLALVELLVDLNSQTLRLEELELPAREYNLLRRGRIPEKGAHYIQYLFQEAKKVSPCILVLEEIDAIARLEKDEGYDLLLRQLLAELDAIDKHYRMVVIAGTEHPENVGTSLLKVGRLERRVTLQNAGNVDPLSRTAICVSCKREVLPEWQHCVYCGALQARTCPHCGAPRLDLEGARFCGVCGNDLG